MHVLYVYVSVCNFVVYVLFVCDAELWSQVLQVGNCKPRMVEKCKSKNQFFGPAKTRLF